MATIAIVGALDTKGMEFAFLKEEIERRGHRTLVIDVGVLGAPAFAPDVEAEEVARAAGVELESLRRGADRGSAVAAMGRGTEALVARLHAERRFDAIIGPMRQLPF